MMQLVSLETGSILVENLVVRDTFFGLLKGFAFQKIPPREVGMFFLNTKNVHTFGMFFSLNLLFFDCSMRFLGEKRNVLPNTIPSSHKNTHHILEIPHHETGVFLPLNEGEQISIIHGGLS